MHLDREGVEVAYNLAAAAVRGFQTAPPPWAVQRHYELLNAEYRNLSGFRSEHGCCCGGEQSKPEQLLSTRQVAKMLGYTKQHVNRKARALGGVKVDGAWIFRESVIVEHIEGRDA